MMPDVVEARLKAWAAEYRGGKYEDIGFPRKNMLHDMMVFRGFFPSGQLARRIPVRSPADDVEEAVQALQYVNQRAAMALRVEYLSGYLPPSERIRKMGRLKMPVSQTHYYTLIEIGRAFVAGRLSIAPSGA